MILSLATTTLRHVSGGRARRQRGRGRARLRRPTRFPSRRVPRRNEPTHPPLPTTSEPDWAKPRRVAFCVGDDAAAVADAWAWTAARFLEPTDDVIMLRVWCPDAAAFRSDVDPDYAAEVDFHQERTTTSWLPPSVRDSLARREVLLRQPLPRRPPRRPRTSPPRVRLPDTARAAPVDVVVLGARPRRPPSLRRSSDRLRRRRSKLAVSLPRPQTRRLRVRRRRGDRLGTGRGTLRGFRFDVAGVPGSPRRRSRGSRGSFARNFRASHARNSRASQRRRVVIAVDGSDASSRAVRWCRDALLRPTDEVILAHAVSGFRNTRSVASTPNRGVASRPVGGDDAHAAAATRDAWRALERALERAGTTPPYPSLGGSDKARSPDVPIGGFLGRGRGASGSSVSGARLGVDWTNFWPSWRRNGGVSMRVASEGRRDVGAAAGRSASRRERRRRGSDRRGESRDGGWRRAMSPSVSTHLVENAPCPCLVYREPAREDEGGEEGKRVGHT